jgi:predicted tellurium resistance membrane protein TerC
MDPAPEDPKTATSTVTLGFAAAIGQILMLDMVFSIDSIITAVGMTEHLPIMIIAVVVSVLVMLWRLSRWPSSSTTTRRW